MYLIRGEVDGYIEENNGNKYLTFASADKNQKVLEKYKKLWDEINIIPKQEVPANLVNTKKIT